MFMSLIELVVLVAVGFGGFYYRAQQQGLLTTGQAAEGEPGTRRISLLTEAAAYAGVILLLVGGVTAISQRWNDITRGGQAGVFAAAAWSASSCARSVNPRSSGWPEWRGSFPWWAWLGPSGSRCTTCTGTRTRSRP